MSDKPKPYSFCPTHMQPSIGPNRCKVCFPGTTSPEPGSAQQINIPPQHSQAGLLESPVSIPSPTLTVSDPDAQKIIDAAKEYAEAVQTMTVIADQLKSAKELVAALETKYTDVKKTAQEKLKLTMEASK